MSLTRKKLERWSAQEDAREDRERHARAVRRRPGLHSMIRNHIGCRISSAIAS
jgi:hypothetical protein